MRKGNNNNNSNKKNYQNIVWNLLITILGFKLIMLEEQEVKIAICED